MSRPTLPVWRFYAYRLSVSNGFWLPVAVVYLQQVRGFGLGEIGFVTAVFSVANVVAEIPTGYAGDRLGRRASLLVGNVVLAAFMAAYTVVETTAAYAVLYTVWAFGWAFRSGTADSWLYELLAAHGETEEFARIRGRAATLERAFEAVTAAAAGAMVVVDWSLPFLANATVAALGIPVLITASSTASTDSAEDVTEAAEPRFTVREALRTLRIQFGRPGVRWLVAYATLFSLLYQVTRVFEQPALETVGVPTAAFGLLYAGMKLCTAVAASTAGWAQESLGIRAVFGLLVPFWLLLLGGVALVPAFVVPVVFLNRSVKAVVRPVRNQYLNDRLSDVGRATVLSGVSMVMMTVGGFGKVVAGTVAESAGLLRVLVVGGCTVALAAGLLWVVTDPVRPRIAPADGEPSGDVATD